MFLCFFSSCYGKNNGLVCGENPVSNQLNELQLLRLLGIRSYALGTLGLKMLVWALIGQLCVLFMVYGGPSLYWLVQSLNWDVVFCLNTWVLMRVGVTVECMNCDIYCSFSVYSSADVSMNVRCLLLRKRKWHKGNQSMMVQPKIIQFTYVAVPCCERLKIIVVISAMYVYTSIKLEDIQISGWKRLAVHLSVAGRVNRVWYHHYGSM